MCIAPLTLSDGTQVACHECWQCRENAINDWVGRNIAESKTALWSRAVTLTYGRGEAGEVLHERAVVLTYSDVQKWIKLLRFHGYAVRYFIVGEFGSANARAHWHVMLYGSGAMPEHDLDASHFMGAHWSHGWSFWTEPTHAAIRYNCKYIQKDMGDDQRQGHMAMSKKPPLGAKYFKGLAEQYVRQGLAPQTLFYSFPEVTRRNKRGVQEVVQFCLKGRSAELFIEHYVTAFERAYPGREFPASELVQNWVQWGVVSVPENVARYGEFVERRSRALPALVPSVVKPKFGTGVNFPWMRSGNVKWNVRTLAWEAPDRPGSDDRLRWVYVEKLGKYAWRKVRLLNRRGPKGSA